MSKSTDVVAGSHLLVKRGMIRPWLNFLWHFNYMQPRPSKILGRESQMSIISNAIGIMRELSENKPIKEVLMHCEFRPNLQYAVRIAVYFHPRGEELRKTWNHMTLPNISIESLREQFDWVWK